MTLAGVVHPTAARLRLLEREPSFPWLSLLLCLTGRPGWNITGLLQETNSIRGPSSSPWMEQPRVSAFITNLLSTVSQVHVEGQQRLGMNLSTME